MARPLQSSPMGSSSHAQGALQHSKSRHARHRTFKASEFRFCCCIFCSSSSILAWSQSTSIMAQQESQLFLQVRMPSPCDEQYRDTQQYLCKHQQLGRPGPQYAEGSTRQKRRAHDMGRRTRHTLQKRKEAHTVNCSCEPLRRKRTRHSSGCLFMNTDMR